MAHPGNQIAIPNMCTPFVHTEYQLVSGVADPFALEYKPVYRGGRVDVDTAVNFGYPRPGPDSIPGVIALDVTPQSSLGNAPFSGPGIQAQVVQNVNNGNPLLSIEPIKSIEWWHLTIWGQEIIRDVTQNPNISPEGIVRASQQVTQLKAEIIWTEFPSIARRIVIDIGTGIDIFLGPTNQVWAVNIMTPDPTSVPPTGLRPGPFTTSAAPGPSTEPPRFRYDAYVAASAWCVYGAVGRPEGRFTQSAFPVNSPGFPEQPVNMPIPDNARRVQLTRDNIAGTPSGIWLYEPGDPTTNLGIITFPAGAGTTFFNDVPQNAKQLRIIEAPGFSSVVTATYEGQQ